MVVSKDNKRKRNKSPAIESSPEMPKRTKVQAQRKFAQGQSAPTSSLPSTSGIASSSQPATSSEPPTDLLPNKRPKTEDFLTFLCFRGTSALPAHLDFLNQNASASNADSTKSTDGELTSNKPDIKTPGKTRISNPLSVNKKESTEPSTSTKSMETSGKEENNSEVMTFPVRKRAGKFPEGNRKTNIRAKRTETEGKSSRRSLRVRGKNNIDNTSSDQEDEKDDKSADDKSGVSKSKIIKLNPKKGEKNSKPVVDSKLQTTKKSQENESPKANKGKRKSSKIPFIESDSKNDNVIDSAVKSTEIKKEETILSTESSTKDKLKRLKRESPIFLPTTEASGRMTRQRAFFEPVKVSTNDGNNKKDVETVSENENQKVSNLKTKSKVTNKGKKTIAKENTKSVLAPKAKVKVTPKKDKTPTKADIKCATKPSPPLRTANKKQNVSSKETNKTTEQETLIPTTTTVKKIPTASSPKSQKSPKKDTKSGMEVFEFSSDDEEPLAKSIQAKKKLPAKSSRLSDSKKNSSDKSLKANKDELNKKIKPLEKDSKITNSNKTTPKSSIPVAVTTIEAESEIKTQQPKNIELKDSDKVLPKLRSNLNSSTKTNNNKDESEDESLEHIREKVLAQKQQILGPAKIDITEKSNTLDANEAIEPEIRSSRPTRKTKEAATIFMGLIGEKLNSSNFEDDNVSMDSFPDLPNVKETEKMETELKKNVGEKKIQQAKVVLNQNTTDAKKLVDKIDVNDIVKRKGRPAKNLEKNIEKGGGTIKEDKNRDEIHVETNKQKEEEDEDFLLNEEVKETKRKLEHSFSDSDDEPLAIKVNKTCEKDSGISKTSEPLPVLVKTLDDESSKLLPIASASAPSTSTPPLSTAVNNINNPNTKQVITPVEQKTPSKIEETFPKNVMAQYPGTTGQPKVKIPVMQPARYHAPLAQYTPPMDVYPTPKINPNFLTPKFDRNLGRGNIDPNFQSPSTTKAVNIPSNPTPKIDSSQLAKPATSVTKTSTTSPDPLKDEIGKILAANLMPSKEESQKIFGIASVSLAQSSGPDNTKCTLGKCGSIHKPLGPVVPTETHLAEQLTSKERRKAKVNMTHEQIQKWLIECSSNPDEIHDDFDDEYESGTPPPPLIIKDDKELSLLSSLKTNKDAGKSEGAWSGRGHSFKATPIVKDTYSKFEDSLPFDSASVTKEISISPVVVSKSSSSSTKKKSSQSNKTKHNVDTEESVAIKPTMEMNVTSTDIPKVDSKEQKAISVLPSTSSVQQPPKTPSKKSTVYNNTTSTAVKDGTTTTDRKKTDDPNSFSAFSANNEKSVYSFDKEDDDIKPLSKSFRRPSQRESNAEEQSQGEKSSKVDKDINQSQTISVTLSPEENMKMISVSLDLEAAVSGGIVDQPLTTELHINELGGMADSDSEGHTFYIPLQGTGVGGVTDANSDTIQGVAVKIGREGSDGPNQKLIMHATLLTKGLMGANTIPIPESMNVSEIVKKLLSKNCKNTALLTEAVTTTTTTTTAATITNSASLGVALNSIVTGQQPIACSSKSVPVGTVQPRFKSDQIQASGSGLQRVNSNSSLFSGSTKSRGPAASATASKKPKDDIPIKMSNNTAFPHHDDPAQMVEAPVFRPTDKEFQDPIEFIERITPIAARFGICKIIPPSTFKPECRVSDDMRFTAYNQYVHKMLHRWGPSAKELSAIKKYLATQNIAMNHPPWIGGMEVDLPRLYHTVQELGGLKEVIEKKKWARVAEEMWIPKTAQDRVTKLDDIYCKYLLPYDTLSQIERQKLFDEVEADWAKREARARRNADRFINTESVSNEDDDISSDDEEESEEEIDGVSMECIVKGRSMPLSQFFRIARNTMSLWFKNTEPTVTEIEAEFWRHVAVRDSHVCVHAGSIDSSGWGYGFPTPGPKGKGSSCARHPWNLKVLTNNSGSVLRSLGPVMGVTVPTLHVGMLFSACCWYRDPHGLSWIEYLHTGASKIWYGIPDDQSLNFRAALTSLIPTHCQNKTIWLPCDTVMVPPHMLTDRGVSLCRTEQKPGEFVVIFPRAYTSSVSTGYVVSESVYFATSSWLELAKDDFKDIHDSCEPAMFSLEQLLFALASDQRVVVDILNLILPLIGEVFDKEIAAREQLKAADVISTAKVLNEKGRNKNKNITTEENECDLCRANLYISMVKTDDNNIYCLQHALKNLNKGNIQAKQCKLIYAYTIEDIENLISSIKDKIAQKKSSINKKGNSQLK